MIGVSASGLGKRCALVLPLLFWTALSTAAGPGRPPPWKATVSAVEYRPADFDDSAGGLELDRIGVEMGLSLPLYGGLVSLRFGQEQSTYRADDARFAGERRADAAEVAIGATYRRREPGWRWFASAGLIDGVAGVADFGDGTYLELGFGAMKQIGDDLLIGVRFNGREGIEHDPIYRVLPLIDYRIDDRNRIGLVRSFDPAFGYSHRLEGGTNIYLAVRLGTRQFRLDDRQALLDKERGLRVGGIFSKHRGFSTEVFAGIVERELEFSRDGSELSSPDLEAGPFYGFAATFRF